MYTMWILNILFAIYALFLNERILLWSEELVNKQKENWQLGLLFLLAFLIEVPAIWITMKGLRQREPQIKLNEGFVWATWAFHTVIGVTLVINILTSFGISFDAHKFIGMTAIFLAVIRELAILPAIFNKYEGSKKVDPKLKFIADLGLLYFACIVFTSTWGLIATGAEPINQSNLILTIINFVCASILFIVFYIPVRFPYFTEEVSLLKNKRQQNIFMLSNIIVCLAALSPLFVFENGKVFVSSQRSKEIVVEKSLRREISMYEIMQKEKLGELNAGISFGDENFIKMMLTRKNPVTLEIGFYPVPTIPDEVAIMQNNLEKLIIFSTGLERVSPMIGRLKNLKKLNLSSNKLESLPESITELTKLTELDLSSNNLTYLPVHMEKLKRLKTANFSLNPLIPEEIERVRDLLKGADIKF